MDFLEVINKRKSVRNYSSKEVEDEKIQEILKVIDSAPSAGNLKSYRVIVVKDKKTREKLTHAALGQEYILQAPVTLVFLADKRRGEAINKLRPDRIIAGQKYGKRGSDLYSVQDATIAASYAQLAAVQYGLSTVWIGAFHPEEVSRIINAKEGEEPIAILPLGYEE